MKKGNKFALVVFAVIVLFLLGCKKQANAPNEGSVDEALKKIKETAKEIVNETLPKAEGESSQVVYLPESSKGSILNQDYKSPCAVERYRGLNVYCKSKTFWHNQSTLLSWYIPYSIVSLLVFIFAVVIVWHLWRNR